MSFHATGLVQLAVCARGLCEIFFFQFSIAAIFCQSFAVYVAVADKHANKHTTHKWRLKKVIISVNVIT